MHRKTWFCLWSSTRTATRSDLSKRETWEEMKRSRRMKLDWSLLSSLTTIRPSLPISFFLLHIERLGLEAEPAMKRNSNCCCNRSWLRNVGREKRWKWILEVALFEILRRRFGARRSIKILEEPWSECNTRVFAPCWDPRELGGVSAASESDFLFFSNNRGNLYGQLNQQVQNAKWLIFKRNVNWPSPNVMGILNYESTFTSEILRSSFVIPRSISICMFFVFSVGPHEINRFCTSDWHWDWKRV